MKFEYNQWWLQRNEVPTRIIMAIGPMVLASNRMAYSQDEHGHRIYEHCDSDEDLIKLIDAPPRELVPFQAGEAYGKKHRRIEDIADNPHPRNTEDHRQWAKGFLFGFANI